MADVAQLVESQIVILVVAGSSPVVRPIVLRKSPHVGLFTFLAPGGHVVISSLFYFLLKARIYSDLEP